MRERGQSVTEFVLLTPLFITVLLGFYQLVYLFIMKQRVEMGAYYVARAYSRETIRGVVSGGGAELEQARREILDGIQGSLREFLGEKAVVAGETGNKVRVTLPVKLMVPGLDTVVLTSVAEMENEPLIYGGGRWKNP